MGLTGRSPARMVAACAVVLAVLAGCSSTTPPEPSPEPSPDGGTTSAEMPRLVIGAPGSHDMIMGARSTGVLTLVAGRCLGVDHGHGSSALAVFPPGTTLQRTGEELVVTLPDGGTASVGSEFTMTGGGWMGDQLGAVLPADVPAECLTERAVQIGAIEP